MQHQIFLGIGALVQATSTNKLPKHASRSYLSKLLIMERELKDSKPKN